jgi:hypothetical protein
LGFGLKKEPFFVFVTLAVFEPGSRLGEARAITQIKLLKKDKAGICSGGMGDRRLWRRRYSKRTRMQLLLAQKSPKRACPGFGTLHLLRLKVFSKMM